MVETVWQRESKQVKIMGIRNLASIETIVSLDFRQQRARLEHFIGMCECIYIYA